MSKYILLLMWITFSGLLCHLMLISFLIALLHETKEWMFFLFFLLCTHLNAWKWVRHYVELFASQKNTEQLSIKYAELTYSVFERSKQISVLQVTHYSWHYHRHKNFSHGLSTSLFSSTGRQINTLCPCCCPHAWTSDNI